MSKDRSVNALKGHLHDQMERLLDPDLNNEELTAEIERTKAVTQLSNQIIDGERVINQRAAIVAEYAPEMLRDVLHTKGITHEG